MTLCEHTMDLAEAHVMRQVEDMISDLADEMMETAEEYEP